MSTKQNLKNEWNSDVNSHIVTLRPKSVLGLNIKIFLFTFTCILRLHDVDEKTSSEDLDAVLQHHHNIQEKLAEEMLSLTRSLKHNTIVASNIIKDDNRVRNSVLNI